MFKSVKRLYKLDITFDYSKKGTPNERRFVKHQAHKRLRRQLKINEVVKNENME